MARAGEIERQKERQRQRQRKRQKTDRHTDRGKRERVINPVRTEIQILNIKTTFVCAGSTADFEDQDNGFGTVSLVPTAYIHTYDLRQRSKVFLP